MGEPCSFFLWTLTSYVCVHLHDALSIKLIPVELHRLTAKILPTAPYTPPPGPTNGELYYSRLD